MAKHIREHLSFAVPLESRGLLIRLGTGLITTVNKCPCAARHPTGWGCIHRTAIPAFGLSSPPKGWPLTSDEWRLISWDVL